MCVLVQSSLCMAFGQELLQWPTQAQDTHLSWVFVNSYVNNSVIITAFLQNGFLNGEVPVFPHFPVKEGKTQQWEYFS